MSEYHDCISLAMALDKTFEEAKSDWNNLNNRLQPDYSFNAKED